MDEVSKILSHYCLLSRQQAKSYPVSQLRQVAAAYGTSRTRSEITTAARSIQAYKNRLHSHPLTYNYVLQEVAEAPQSAVEILATLADDLSDLLEEAASSRKKELPRVEDWLRDARFEFEWYQKAYEVVEPALRANNGDHLQACLLVKEARLCLSWEAVMASQEILFQVLEERLK